LLAYTVISTGAMSHVPYLLYAPDAMKFP